MKLKLHDWLSRILRPEKKSSIMPGLVIAAALFAGLNGWSQCAPVLSGVSNITSTTATVNWNAVSDLPATTYTLEVYTNAGLTTPFGSYPAVAATSFNLTGLVNNTIYYFRVKTNNGTCTDFSATGNFTAQIGYTPLDVTGFTADVIANGVGPASGSSTHSVDSGSANNAYLCIDYKPLVTSPALTYGLPVNRTLNSPTTGLQYLLANYSNNNSLRLSATNDFGVLTLAQPQKLTNLFLAVASGDGGSQVSVEIQFSDGTFQTANSVTMTNWDSSPVAPIVTIVNGIGRVNRGDGNPSGSSNSFKLFQAGIAIDAANHSKTVNSIKITKTNTSNPETQIPNIFAISGRITPTCPAVTTSATTLPTFATATFNWALSSLGASGATSATYTLEVYTDATYTTQIPGSPFNNLTATSQVVSGLTLDTTYYYRVRGTGGTCVGEYATGTYTHAYCTPTSTTNTNNITTFTTTGGYLNINNTSGGAGYANFATQIVAKEAGGVINFNGVKTVASTRVTIYVDWNKDLDFDDTGEAVYTLGTNSNVNFSGTFTVPAGAVDGLYRMRVRSSSSTAITPCGNITNGDTEDYTLMVAVQPTNCTKPATPTLAVTNPTATALTVTASSGVAPTGYLLVRSSQTTLGAAPTDTTQYTVGASIGSGTIVALGTSPTFTDFIGSNTRFYYYVFAYNYSGTTCLGPTYSDPATANGTTCAKAVQNANASNITKNSAVLNWSGVVGNGGNAATYTVEIYNNSALTNLFGSFNSATNSYSATGLTNGNTYYYRVRATTTACHDNAWSGTASFTAQNNYTPLSLTGFNFDVIANGTGIAKFSTTESVDAVNYSYIALDYERTSGNVTTVGLPLNRTISNTTPPVSFLFQDYGSNNSLKLAVPGQVGLLTLTQPFKASDLYVALTSGSGASIANYVVNFQDTTTQTGNISLLDWFSTLNTNLLITGIGRVLRNDNIGNVETGNAKVFYAPIAIDAANQGKNIVSVQFTKSTTTAADPAPNIFGISAKLIDECPILGTVTNVPAGNNATINWTLATGSAAATSYTVEVYTNSTYTNHVTGSPFTVTSATTLNVTGLSPLTQYYYRVQAVNASCNSAYSTGSFTTTCVAPAAPVASATQTHCSPATVQNLTATAVTGATLNWYNSATSTTVLANTASIATGNYYVSQTLNGCESTRTTVAVTVSSVVAPTAAATQAVCTGATIAQLNVTGATGATFTWSATQGGAGLPSTTVLNAGNYYVTQTVGTCTGPATTVAVTINSVNAPTATAQTHCTGITFAQLNVTGATGATFTWSSTQGGAALTGTVNSGTYYVTQTVGTCTSTATQVVVTINTTPVPSANAQTYCIGTTVAALTATGVTGGTITWSATQAGAPLLSTEVLASGTYFVSQTLNECKSAPVPVTVTINSTAAPTADATQTYCIGATVENLAVTTLTGATAKWSTTLGGAALASTEVLASGTYYVTQTLNTCESTATTVSVVINSTEAPTASQQFFCAGALASQLEATTLTGATVIWSSTEGGTAIDGTALLETGTYYVRQILNDCVSPSTPVSVVVNTTPAPGASNQTFCVGATVEDLVANNTTGATVKWYLTTGGNVLDQATVLETGTYYVTQTLNLCESTATEILVTVNTVAAPTADAQTFCAGTTAEELVVTGETGATFTWSTTEGGQAIAPTTILIGGTYYVTQTVGDCTSTATAVTVTINEVPNAPSGNQTQSFIDGDTIADLTINTVSGATVQWYTLEGDVYTTIDSDTELVNGATYYVTQATNSCESDYLAVTVSSEAGRDDFKFAKLSVYPNPTKDVITVSNSSAISKVTVVNLLGQTIVEQKTNTDTVQVNLSNIAAGTYILQVTSEGASTSVKVIKH